MYEQSKQRRMRNNVIRSARFSVEDMDYVRKPEDVDALTKAQNIKAARILLDRLYEQEVTRNTPDVIKGYVDNKTGKYVDTVATGRTPIDPTPPPDWPLSENEWIQATQYGSFSLLNRVTGYMLQEQERQHRKHQTMYDFGASALDPEQVERLRKTKEKQHRINQRNWRNRMKQAVEVSTTQEGPMPYVSSSDPYAEVATDLVTRTNNYAELLDQTLDL